MKQFFSLLLILASAQLYAQQSDSVRVRQLLAKIDAYNSAFTSEKLYVNFDKPYYAIGDTIWMKVYVLNGATYRASQSAKLYLELFNDSSRLVQRLVLPAKNGLAQGYLPLDAKNIDEGNYTIRAYTSWQQNFGDAYFFYKQFSVGSIGSKTWLVSSQQSLAEGGKQVKLALHLRDAQGIALAGRKVNLRLFEDGKPKLKSTVTTNLEGTVASNFSLPENVDKRKLTLRIEDAADKEQQVSFPFYVSGPGTDVDVQFMPEGGSLVAGLYNKVGFKAIGVDGLGINIKGKIIDSKGEEVAELNATHAGMGSFVLVPQATEVYTAVVMANGVSKNITLPPAKPAGIGLRVDAISNPADVIVYISNNQPVKGSFAIVVRSRDNVHFGLPFTFNQDGYYNLRIPKAKLPTGINNLLILDDKNAPLNQRSIFINHHDELKLSANAMQGAYKPRDSVALELSAFDKEGKPIVGAFSVAVTDDNQVKQSPENNHIGSYMLLTAELAGNVENPAWYFAPGDERAKEKALDELLLTQGWISYDDKDVFLPVKQPAFAIETDNTVSGKLINFLKKPVSGASVRLMSMKGGDMFIMDTLSNKDGRFSFSNLPVTDTPAYSIKVHNKKGGSSGAGIYIDEFKAAGPLTVQAIRSMPWRYNTDTTILKYINTSKQHIQQMEAVRMGDVKGNLLKDVTIKARKPVAGVKGIYGEDIFNPDLVLNEKQVIELGRINFISYLERNVKNFRSGKKGKDPSTKFFMGANEVMDIVIDGINVNRYYQPLDKQDAWVPDHHYKFLRSFLEYIIAADVKQFVVYHRYMVDNKAKGASFNGGLEDMGVGDYYAVMAITTRSGAGPSIKSSPGVYAYRPLPMQLPKSFYRPKYQVNQSANLPDFRSTIHWDPNVVTNEQGKATISFYAADRPGTYTVTVEGTDMEGRFGVLQSRITISKPNAQGK